MLWSALIVATSIAGAPVARPLLLDVSQSGDQLLIRLVGESSVACSASYELEVIGGQRRSSNRSTQRGTVVMRPSEVVTVATLRLGNRSEAHWTARLHVNSTAGPPYDLQWRSDAPDPASTR